MNERTKALLTALEDEALRRLAEVIVLAPIKRGRGRPSRTLVGDELSRRVRLVEQAMAVRTTVRIADQQSTG